MKRTTSGLSERLKKKGRAPLVENRPLILAALQRGETMASAARRGGIGETVLRERMAGDAGFAEEVGQARAEGRERRAEELEEVLYAGAMRAATDPRYTGALIFALCNLDPEHWRHVQHIHGKIDQRQVVEHDLADSLADILRDIAGGPAEVLDGRGAPALPSPAPSAALPAPAVSAGGGAE